MLVNKFSVPILLLLVVFSAFAVIYAKHQNRMSFFELQALKEQRDLMNVEWGQLQLEQSTLVMNGRIERMARKNLKMIIPQAEQVVMIRP